MNFEDIYTLADNSSRRYIGLYDIEYKYICYCNIKIYGIPRDLSIEQQEEMYGDEKLATYIGTIEGYLILAEEIEKRGLDLHYECDAINGEVEFICSALLENGGPLEDYGIEYQVNQFYIHKIEIDEEYYTDELFDNIISELPEIIFIHYHVCPEMLIYYPTPLPYDNRIEELEKKIAEAVMSDTLKRESKDYIADYEPQLVMNPDQINIVLGRRRDGYTYPEYAKNMSVWEKYERNGFDEWLNTRVLYSLALK